MSQPVHAAVTKHHGLRSLYATETFLMAAGADQDSRSGSLPSLGISRGQRPPDSHHAIFLVQCLDVAPSSLLMTDFSCSIGLLLYGPLACGHCGHGQFFCRCHSWGRKGGASATCIQNRNSQATPRLLEPEPLGVPAFCIWTSLQVTRMGGGLRTTDLDNDADGGRSQHRSPSPFPQSLSSAS